MERTMNILSIMNVAALFITLCINWLSNRLPLNGQTTGEISAKVPVLFTPAPFAFGIWGVIYLFLLAFAAYQLLPAQHTALFQERIGYWFVVSCAFNCAWLFLWHYEQFLFTMPAMLGLLASLIIIYWRLGIGVRQVSRTEFWLVHVPFSTYLGWVSVATLANIAIVLYAQGVDSLGLPPALFTLMLMALAAVLGAAMIVQRNEIAYPLVIAWALLAIAVRHQQTRPELAIPAALLLCAVVIILLFVRLDRNPELLIVGTS